VRISLAVWILCVALCGCGKSDPGKDVAHVASDTEILREASEAVNQVVREAGDCDAMKPGLEPARQSLDEAAGRIRTVTGQATLDALRKRLDGLAEVCP
jgi:hypothetical protein